MTKSKDALGAPEQVFGATDSGGTASTDGLPPSSGVLVANGSLPSTGVLLGRGAFNRGITVDRYLAWR